MIYTIVSYMDTLAMLERCQIRLDFVEYLIYVRSGTAQLRSEPSDRVTLVAERMLNQLSDVDHG